MTKEDDKAQLLDRDPLCVVFQRDADGNLHGTIVHGYELAHIPNLTMPPSPCEGLEGWKAILDNRPN